MNLGLRQSLFNDSKIKPIIWFDAIYNISNNQHAQLDYTTPWKSVVNSDVFDAITYGGNPIWNDKSVSFNSSNQIYKIRMNKNINGFWNEICNTVFSWHVTLKIGSMQHWNGVCGATGDTLNTYGIGIRCANEYLNIGELYGLVSNACYNHSASLISLNELMCIDIVVSDNKYLVYINGLLQYSNNITPFIFGKNLVFKIGHGWEPNDKCVNDQTFRGSFHELQIFNIALNEKQINMLVNTSFQRYA